MSHSRQGKSWLRPCTVDRRLATPWLTNGLVSTTAMTRVNDEGVYNSQLRRAVVKAPNGERV